MFLKLIFILKKNSLTHKLQYAKTLKGDWAGALFGCIMSIVVGYIALSTFGGFSVDMVDLYHFIICGIIVGVLVNL